MLDDKDLQDNLKPMCLRLDIQVKKGQEGCNTFKFNILRGEGHYVYLNWKHRKQNKSYYSS